MITVVVNPGSGPIGDETDYDNAYKNMIAFMEDVGRNDIFFLPLPSKHSGKDGRYAFGIYSNSLGEPEHVVLMPGLPLDQVRWRGPGDGSIWHFPRLYIDGGSWIWKFALEMVSSDEEE